MNPLAGLERTVGKDLFQKIQSSKILCVGAGGIGCELLKDLALSGFRNVEVIDLDTIDVSNLNRQLLFRGQHVGMPKCTVACQVAGKITETVNLPSKDSNIPAISYLAHHGNVCDTTKFNVPFVERFDLVLNALDNVEARRRVNRLCLAADVPLIEAGTTGYLGQVTVIHKSSNVACYECATKEAQKVYPICTIRSTPSMPVHTIVWSKELYKLLFHSKVKESMLFEDPDGEEPSTYMKSVFRLRDLLQKKSKAERTTDLFSVAVKDLLNDLYSVEIKKQLDMGRYKAAKKTPTCIEATLIEKGTLCTSPPLSTNEAWSPEDSIAVLIACLVEGKNAPNANILEEFDKDDRMAMRFVTAASNLRSFVFGIEPLQSLYSAKGIAGNIIPAIATTNAICAGLQILQAFSVLRKQLQLQHEATLEKGLYLKDSCYYVNCLRNRTRNGLYLTAAQLDPPNPNCFVCKNAIIPLTLSVSKWTLQELLQRVIKGRLGFEEPTLILRGNFIWEEGDGAEEDFKDNLPKKLPDLPCGGIRNGSVLDIDDNSQDMKVCVTIINKVKWEGKSPEDFPFIVGGVPAKTSSTVAKGLEAKNCMVATSTEETNGTSDDDEVMVVAEDQITKIEVSSVKRLNERDADSDRPTKKKRKDYSNNGIVIDLEV